ncbi:MAG: alpha/beta hydrolase-fold protein [Defluviitaleaceae bacterium]|nr:alpha/beta hydrolase-fold protein [Defluviitaleaceae bacterium]
MAKISLTVKSESLGFHTHLEVIFPEHDVQNAKVLYLLHGLSDDCTAWGRMTRIYHYAMMHNYIVIMPEVQRSFYSDMAFGSQYLTYVSRELPVLCEKILNIRHVREKTFVAGLSMGGYGAAKIGLSRPDFYNAIASFSGAMDMKYRTEAAKKMEQNPLPETRAILGDVDVYPDKEDLFFLASQVAKMPSKPRMFITCGDKDFLLDDNRRFDAHLQSLNYSHIYKEWEGNHTWDFWEECLPMTFDFFGEPS